MDDIKIKSLMETTNAAENLDKQKLTDIGKEAKSGFDQDVQSRKEWEDKMEEWIELAKQVAHTKTYPWKSASNVKYPLLSTAAMQFAARAYPSLVPSDRQVVKSRPIGKDPDGTKTQIADAISTYMSYQLMDEMDGWEEDMDKLLIMLPVIGVMFKKTYWDTVKKVNCSKLVLPKNLVVNYWAENLCDAERVSEILYLSERKVKERQLAKLWLDVDLGKPPAPETAKDQPPLDATTPYVFIEQHTFLDLDDDGYPEPYIVTFQRQTGKVVRIAARFDQDCITMSDDGKDVVKIEPIEYYTKFGFIPSADGGFYDEGFGTLLGPLNESVNTLINQLIDAGHMSSLQAGFLGKGLRLRMGETQFKPNEWKVVNATGDDLRKQIVPLPTKEPSKVLFELMGSLITSGKELASVAEIFVGKMPGQNTPATTTMATIEQGMKVFTAVYKRIYRSLSEEFQKLYRLNAIYLNPGTDVDAKNLQIGPEDFDLKSHKIYPGADPSAISQTEKLMKAQGLMELLQTGVLDPVKVVLRVMEAQEQPNIQELINKQVAQTGALPPPPPDPKTMALQAKSQLDAQAAQQDMAIKDHEAQLKSAGIQQDLQAQQVENQLKMQDQQTKSAMQEGSQQYADAARIAQAERQHQQDMAHAQDNHQQQMVHAHQQNQAKVAAIKTQAKAKPAAKGPTKK